MQCIDLLLIDFLTCMTKAGVAEALNAAIMLYTTGLIINLLRIKVLPVRVVIVFHYAV